MLNGYRDNELPLKSWGIRELTLSALFFHPELNVARTQWRAAVSGEITAAQRPLPGISGGTEHHSDTANGQSPWTYSLGIDLPIETAGKREARIDRAVRLSEAARIDIAQSAWQVRSRVINSWLAYSHSTALLSIIQQELQLRDEIIAMLDRRLQEGMVSSVEAANFRLQRQGALRAYAAEKGRQAALKAELATNAGLTVEMLEQLPLQQPDFQLDSVIQPAPLNPTIEGQLRDAALLNRLDLRAALSRYAAAEARLRLEIARQYPDITLSPGYSYDQGDKFWSLGISALLTLVHKNRGLIAEARALREVEGAQFEALQAKILGQLEQSKAVYTSALSEMDKTAEYLRASESQVSKIRRQFNSGYADRLELRTIELENQLALQNLLNARYRYRQSVFALEEIAQRPIEMELGIPSDMENIVTPPAGTETDNEP